ncbi:XRE family transcriptional regulator [Azospirillaceae bacterium]
MKKRALEKGEGTNEVDALVGRRLKELRMLAGLSQGDLAATIGLTFQQLQKYERGVNRISASKLYLLALHLKVSVSAFFSDLEGQQDDSRENFSVVAHGVSVGETASAGDDVEFSREGQALSRSFQRICDSKKRDAIRAFVEACAGVPSTDHASVDHASVEESDGEGGNNGGLRGVGSDDAPKKSRRPRGATWHPSDISRR